MSVDIDPDTINLQAGGNWITAYLTFPAGFDPRGVDPASIQLIGVPAAWGEVQWNVLAAKFDHETVAALLSPGTATLWVTAMWPDGTMFFGSDTVTVQDEPGKPKETCTCAEMKVAPVDTNTHDLIKAGVKDRGTKEKPEWVWTVKINWGYRILCTPKVEGARCTGKVQIDIKAEWKTGGGVSDKPIKPAEETWTPKEKDCKGYCRDEPWEWEHNDLVYGAVFDGEPRDGKLTVTWTYDCNGKKGKWELRLKIYGQPDRDFPGDNMRWDTIEWDKTDFNGDDERDGIDDDDDGDLIPDGKDGRDQGHGEGGADAYNPFDPPRD